MFKKSLPMGMIAIVMIISLAFMSLAYAHWTDQLQVDGTVTTGSLDAKFDSISDNDNGLDPWMGTLPQDPKNVGDCMGTISTDGDTATVTILNAYPSYSCEVTLTVKNTGTVPWKFIGFTKTVTPPATESDLDLDWIGNVKIYNGTTLVDQFSASAMCGKQVDPTWTVVGTASVHVNQSAVQNGTYTGTLTFGVVNWNEWESSQCVSPYIPPVTP